MSKNTYAYTMLIARVLLYDERFHITIVSSIIKQPVVIYMNIVGK